MGRSLADDMSGSAHGRYIEYGDAASRLAGRFSIGRHVGAFQDQGIDFWMGTYKPGYNRDHLRLTRLWIQDRLVSYEGVGK